MLELEYIQYYVMHYVVIFYIHHVDVDADRRKQEIKYGVVTGTGTGKIVLSNSIRMGIPLGTYYVCIYLIIQPIQY